MLKKYLAATGLAENQPYELGKSRIYLLSSSNSQNVYKLLLKTTNYLTQDSLHQL